MDNKELDAPKTAVVESDEVSDASKEKEAKKAKKAEKAREKQLEKDYKKMKRKKHPFLRALKYAFVGILIGAVVGAVGVLWLQRNAPDPINADDGDAVTLVFERVMDEGELVTASQTYVNVEKVTDTKSFYDLFDIPFTENSYWYRYAGTIKAAVDLETAKLVSQAGNTITLSMGVPYISSNTPDMEVSGVLEENNNLLNPIELKSHVDYEKTVKERVEAAALEGDLIETAKKNAEVELAKLFSVALGNEYIVVIEWV